MGSSPNSLFEGEALPLGGAPDDIPHVDAPVVEDAVRRGDVLALAVVGDVVGLDLRHPGQPRQHAAAVLVPEPALDVVLLVQAGVDEVLLFPLLLQRQDRGGDLTVGVFPVLFPNHGAGLLSEAVK